MLRALPATERVLALTFGACGGPGGRGCDQNLIDFPRRRLLPAILSPATAPGTARCRSPDDPPAAIPGTRDAGEVRDEVTGNRSKLTQLPGDLPRFFRAGTAYGGGIAPRAVADPGERIVTFSGDAGAAFTPEQVRLPSSPPRAAPSCSAA